MAGHRWTSSSPRGVDGYPARSLGNPEPGAGRAAGRARVFDGNGKELTNLRRLDGKGNPLYQVDVTSLGNLQIQPPLNSTADLHLVGHVVVTENDGDHKSFDVPSPSRWSRPSTPPTMPRPAMAWRISSPSRLAA